MNIMHKIKNLLIVSAVLITSICNTSFASNTVAGQEMRTQVLYLAGVIDNDNNMTSPMTREEFAKILTKASKYKDSVDASSATSVFTDVLINNQYAGYVKIATDMGYMSGYLGGLFKPYDVVTYKDLIRGCLALLSYTNDDFTGQQTLGRYQKFCALDLNTNIDKNKQTGDIVTKLDIVNAIYNTLKAKVKDSNTVYGTTIFDLTVDTDGELNASGLTKVNMQGPFIMKRGTTLYQVLPFTPENANYFLNGTSSSFSNIQREVSNTGFVILYYNETTRTVYAYKEGTSPDTTVNVTSGYITHIYYNASDNLTPASIEIEQARYYLGNAEVRFAFSYAGTLHVGDRVVFIYQKSNDQASEDSESSGAYAGTITSAFLYDVRYE